MNLIILYGLPAVGKLTVAKELSKIIDYKIFHNHLSYEIVFSITEEKDEFFWEQVRKLRFEMIKIASKRNVNLIFTSCYLGKESDKFFKPLVKLMKKEKINVSFIHLFCDEKEILGRVKEESRKEYNKLICPVELKKNIDKIGINLEIPYVKSIKIDSTNLSAKKVAKKIKEFYSL